MTSVFFFLFLARTTYLSPYPSPYILFKKLCYVLTVLGRITIVTISILLPDILLIILFFLVVYQTRMWQWIP